MLMTKRDIFKISLNFSLPLELEAATEGNKQPFVATITFAGLPSDGPVGGTESIEGGPYRVLMPVELMQAKLESLKGKGVFAAESLDTHSGASRIGTFEDAWAQRFPGTDIEAVKTSGFFNKARDPELVAKIIDRARAGELGFSYDLKNAPVEIVEVDGEMIAQLLDFEWRGATVLYRQTAAYQFTDLAAHLAGKSGKSIDNNTQDPPSTSTRSTAGSGMSKENEVEKKELQELFASNLKPITDGQEALKKELTEKVDGLVARVTKLEDGKPAAPEPGKSADGGSVSMEKFMEMSAAANAKAMGEAVRPLADAIEKLQAGADPGEGTRRTLSAEAIDTFKRFGGEIGDDEELSVAHLSQTIDAVKANKALTKSQITASVQTLMGMKLTLQRQERARVMGGVN